MTPPTRATPSSGPPAWRDPQAGQRNTTEREREPDDLDEGVGRRPADHPPRAGRGDECGDGVATGEDRAGGDVARHRELHHPPHARRTSTPAPNSQPSSRRWRRVGRAPSGDLEQHHADDGERPETPRRQRERDEQPAAEAERRPSSRRDAACDLVRHVRSGGELGEHDDALARRAGWMAGEQRRRDRRCLVDDPHRRRARRSRCRVTWYT